MSPAIPYDLPRLVERLISLGPENDWLELKLNLSDPFSLGKYISALCNGAAEAGQPEGFLLWGVDDTTREITGTTFKPLTEKKGGQPLMMWLSQMLKPSPAFTFKETEVEGKRVVVGRFPAPTVAPITFQDIPYIRVGESTPKLTDFPERYARLIEAIRPFTWEKGVAMRGLNPVEVLERLDSRSYFRMIGKPAPESREGILEYMEKHGLVRHELDGAWSITNLGAISISFDLSPFDEALRRKGLRITQYEGKDKAAEKSRRRDIDKGYAIGLLEAMDVMEALLPNNEHVEAALRVSTSIFPSVALRELLANALIHQDFTLRGTGPSVQIFEGRIEIVNPGTSLLPTERMIDYPPKSRNEALASLMRQMKLCEEEGTGLDKVVSSAEVFQLPPPLFSNGHESFVAVLYAPRSFQEMDAAERIRACYQHAVLRWIGGGTAEERFSL